MLTMSSSSVNSSPNSILSFKSTNTFYSNDIHCLHTITQKDSNSILSLAVHKSYLFSGSEGSKIYVWDLKTFQLVTTLDGHCGSVLDLTISQDQNWLFSCSGDGTVRVWCIKELQCKYAIQSCHDVGDIFSIIFTERSKKLILGCQNTSIQWYDLEQTPTQNQHVVSLKNCQKTQFFQLFHELGFNPLVPKQTIEEDVIQCVIKPSHVCSNAHDGYVYCMAYTYNIPNLDGEVLITGSGDGNVKIWSVQYDSIIHHRTLNGKNTDRGILSIAISEEGYLYCGAQGGHIQVWDLETYQMIRSVAAHSDDVLSVITTHAGFITASADGVFKSTIICSVLIDIWNEAFDNTNLADEHNGIILAMKKTDNYLITATSNHLIMVWDLPLSATSSLYHVPHRKTLNDLVLNQNSQDMIAHILEKWISIRTISGYPQFLEECRRGARYFKNVLQQLGATSQMLPTVEGKNPIIYAKFSANAPKITKETPTVLIYGHYDVMTTENDENEWLHDPFELSGINGYLYGRGTSDNKGPIVASVMAVHELLNEGTLDANVIFLIEGEEENGSGGFIEAINANKHLFLDIDLIILSNSYWLGEDIPCITYGMRGVIHANVAVTSSLPDLHSGVEGGSVSEPLMNLVHVLGKLVNKQKQVLVPGFYDDVLPLTRAEEKLYDPIVDWIQSSSPDMLSTGRFQHSCISSPTISSCSNVSNSDDEFASVCSSSNEYTCEQIKKQLMSKWRYPTLTIHKVDASMENKTVISHCASATISMRIVPNQSIEIICKNLTKHIYQSFDKLKSDNRIQVEIQSVADYWLGDPYSKYFRIAELAVEEEWKVKPLYIREGGSIPAVKWLESFCQAPAIHIPFGQSSDQAHLPNERIRLSNLHAGKRIMKTLLKNL